MRALVGAQLGSIARRPGQLLLTGLAVLVASFIIVVSVQVQQMLARTVAADASVTPAAADLMIGRLDGTGTPTTVLGQVQRLPEVTEAAGRLAVSAVVGGPGGDDLRFAADPGYGALATVRVPRGSYPDAAGEIAVTARTAQRMELPVGVVTTARIENCGSDPGVCTESQAVSLTVTAVADAGADSGHDAVVLIGGASLRGLSEWVLTLATPADFEIRTNTDTALPAGLVDQLRARTDVTHVAPYRWVDDLRLGTVPVPGGLTGSAADLAMDVLPRLRELDADSGYFGDLRPGHVVLDRATSPGLGLAAGDWMVLTAERERSRWGSPQSCLSGRR